jgi:hypothetical protein
MAKRFNVKLDLTMTEARALQTLLKSVGPDPGWMIENLLDALFVAMRDARRARETVGP